MKTFVMIPTYNEKENIANLINEISKLKIKNLHIVVVDDNSPDGTWRIVEEISKTLKNQRFLGHRKSKGFSSERKNVHLLLRKKNKGRGFAGKDGFIYCLKNNADIIVEMDADFSHNPKYIPIMLKEIKNYDIVLGSRQVKEGKDVGRSFIRKIITKLANLYISIIFGIKVKDCNSGFRCFKREILEKIKLENLESKGPSIVQEVLFKANLKKARIKEIPITFVDRKKGISKLGLKQLMIAYFIVMKLKIQHLFGLM